MPSRPPPTAKPVPRTSLAPAAHDTVNFFLKALKSHLRCLTPTFAQISAELAVLERLYYKGKNQHRSSLFWQRVSEARRYGHRLQEIDVPSMVESLRGTFHGEPATVNAKALKGAWSHYPRPPSITFVLRQLRSCTQLLEKAHTRFLAIYQFFTLAMQSGAFLQLIVVLAALISKLDCLVLDAIQALAPLHRDCYSLLRALYPQQARKVQPLDAPGAVPPVLPPEIPSAPEPAVNDEDTGMAIARPTTARPAKPKPLIDSGGRELASPASIPLESAVRISSIDTYIKHEETLFAKPNPLPSPQIRLKQEDTLFALSASSSAIALRKRKEPAGPEREGEKPTAHKKPKKAKKPRRDEIDDIFS